MEAASWDSVTANPETVDVDALGPDVLGPGAWDPDVLGVLMAPFTGTELPDWVGEALDAGLASVILFGHNTPDAGTAGRLARAVHERAEECVVAIDEEGGDVTRLQALT
ncbi:MAG: hypothetical protein ACTIK7_10200, partial [Brachybacterium sp.]